MSKRRRSWEFPLHGEEPDLDILVHDRPGPIRAHWHVLSLFSACVKELPRGQDGGPVVWDLRGLVAEGASERFGAVTVERYLDLIYARVDTTRRFQAPSKLEEVKPLVLFADAVASSKIVFQELADIISGTEGLSLTFRVSPEIELDFQLQKHLYVFYNDGLYECTVPYSSVVDTRRLLLQSSSEAFTVLRSQPSYDAICNTLEEWLHLAGRLRMLSLLRLLVGFIKTQLAAASLSLCPSDSIKHCFSPRVLQCMPSELLFEAFVRDCLLDVPSEIKLEASEARVVLASPASATFLPLDVTKATDVEVKLQGRQTLVRSGGAHIGCTIRLGGFTIEACEAIVRQAVKDAHT